jgi:hypothetical protein
VRTPTAEGRPPLWKGVAMAAEEGVLMLLLWLAAFATWWWHGTYDPETRYWSAVLIVASLPYLAALGTSVLASFHEGRPAGAARRRTAGADAPLAPAIEPLPPRG